MKDSSLISTLMYFPCFKYSNPREVPDKRCSGFLEIPGLREMANMER
jgi:hypothetical protein